MGYSTSEAARLRRQGVTTHQTRRGPEDDLVLPKSTTPRTTARPATGYFLGLDGLRGIAVLAVLGYHFGAAFLTGGYLGVDVFFVISGFVVTRNLVRLMDESEWAQGFYVRRVSRLYPVLLVFLVALAVFWLVDGVFAGDSVIAIVGGALMSYNLALVYFGAEAEGPLHLWSLGVEWHFYLLAPLLLAVGGRRLAPLTRAIGLLGIAGLIAAVRLVLLLTDSVDSLTIYLHTLTRLDGLLIGCAIALAPLPLLSSIPVRRVMGFLLAGLLAAMVIGPAWGLRAPVTLGLVVPLVGALTAGITIAVVNIAVVNDRGQGSQRPLTQALLESPVLKWAGQRSYSLYLWHYFVGVSLIANGEELWQGWPTFILQVALSLIAAELSFRFVERPLRRAINRLI